MSDALTSPRLKLKRAWSHLKALKAEARAFIDSRPYLPTVDFNVQTQRLTIAIKQERTVDPIWSTWVGDILHNFRGSLDHVVWQLAGRPKVRETKTQFPIFETEAGFRERGVKVFLKGVPSDAVALIKSEQPFARRNEGTVESTRSPLWHLKELHDVDKHRRLHITTAAVIEHEVTFPRVAIPFQTIDVVQQVEGVVTHDSVIWTGILKGAHRWPFEKGDIQAKLGIDILFDEGEPSPGLWNVVGTLAEIGNRTEYVIRRIAEEILKTGL